MTTPLQTTHAQHFRDAFLLAFGNIPPASRPPGVTVLLTATKRLSSAARFSSAARLSSRFASPIPWLASMNLKAALKLPPRPLAGPASHRADSCSGLSSAASASDGSGCLHVPAARTAGIGMLSATTAPGRGTGRQRPCQVTVVSEMRLKSCPRAGRAPRSGAAGPERARQG